MGLKADNVDWVAALATALAFIVLGAFGCEAGAINDIETNTHTYHVDWPEKRTQIRVVNGPTGKYLRTDRDDTNRNNLDDLPDC